MGELRGLKTCSAREDFDFDLIILTGTRVTESAALELDEIFMDLKGTGYKGLVANPHTRTEQLSRR